MPLLRHRSEPRLPLTLLQPKLRLPVPGCRFPAAKGASCSRSGGAAVGSEYSGSRGPRRRTCISRQPPPTALSSAKRSGDPHAARPARGAPVGHASGTWGDFQPPSRHRVAFVNRPARHSFGGGAAENLSWGVLAVKKPLCVVAKIRPEPSQCKMSITSGYRHGDSPLPLPWVSLLCPAELQVPKPGPSRGARICHLWSPRAN